MLQSLGVVGKIASGIVHVGEGLPYVYAGVSAVLVGSKGCMECGADLVRRFV